jgi:hypothetical protein
MKNRFALISLSSLVILLTTTQCKSPDRAVDCAQAICTMEFRMVNVVLKDKSGNFCIADKVQTFTEVGKLIYTQTLPNYLPDTNYTVIDDGMLKELSRDIDNKLYFKVYKNGSIVKTLNYTLTADCCHITKVDGASEVIIE